ncbi:Hyaluronan synthase [Acaryochloris thomasi RCC1774]|uniref:Hyaluronan synthase n=1 Tax=Acaryochloris thomasi RCC1774 TaxID=1764569 RepID=A0A2W1JRR5_9CYAN|nr:glycosyltransferase [Acaryochloris thomasi]PZD71771.1 Hyaluronan synthase [Acaryochloris thomasi RCC1774]
MVFDSKVSIIIPAFNVASYLQSALESVERQSYQNFEAIVVNDGSTDNTAEIASSFCECDSRFHLLSKPNGGLSSARNYGIRHSQGEYIALLDGDDVYEPDKLLNHVFHLDRLLNVGVVYSASRAIREDGQSTPMYLSGKPVKQNDLAALLCKNFVGHGSNSIFRRCIFEEIGEFDERLKSCEDLDFWLRVASAGRWQFYRESKILCQYRVRPSGLSFNVTEMQRCNERVLEMARNRMPSLVEPLLPTANAYMYRYLARLSLTAGNIGDARKFIDKALSSDRSIFLLDWRSFLTLMSVRLAPISKIMLHLALGSHKSLSQTPLISLNQKR